MCWDFRVSRLKGGVFTGGGGGVGGWGGGEVGLYSLPTWSKEKSENGPAETKPYRQNRNSERQDWKLELIIENQKTDKSEPGLCRKQAQLNAESRLILV